MLENQVLVPEKEKQEEKITEEILKGEVVNTRKQSQPSWNPQDADREDIKFYIRQRVQNASVPEGTIFRKAKPKPSINDTDEKVVAVYARVSTKSTEQVSSIENQTRYYTEKIEGTPNWNMSKIYADEGKSGTSMKKRTEFRQMLQDAMNKKMDLILCASVSRFARNMTDCMEQVSNLRTENPSHPVGVYFETENIYTLDPDCDQALSIHAMLADWESANKSRRMILSYDQRICTGQYPVCDLLGYRHTSDGKLIIQEDEAVTVRYIFLAKVRGDSLADIADVLTDKERKSLTGRTEWNEAMVRNVLNNERRWGDLEARKTIVIDYKKGKTVKNVDIRDSAYVPNHHEGIVSREIAKAAKLALHGDGVPEFKVIENGALRGYVSIHPSFAGISAEELFEISSSAYSELEKTELKHREKILNGEEHCKIISKDFAGYHVPNSAFFISASTPTLTINHGTFRFSKKCIEKLDNCDYIEILYHPLLQAILIRPSNEENVNSVCWKNAENHFNGLFAARALSDAIYHHLDWIKEYGFRFRGVTKVRGKQKMILFFLDEPQILVNQKEKDDGVRRGAEAEYIPYRYKELYTSADNEQKNGIAAQIGRNYRIQKRRNQLINMITEADIQSDGISRINPMIGELPSREEMEEKLEELLMIM